MSSGVPEAARILGLRAGKPFGRCRVSHISTIPSGLHLRLSARGFELAIHILPWYPQRPYFARTSSACLTLSQPRVRLPGDARAALAELTRHLEARDNGSLGAILGQMSSKTAQSERGDAEGSADASPRTAVRMLSALGPTTAGGRRFLHLVSSALNRGELLGHHLEGSLFLGKPSFRAFAKMRAEMARSRLSDEAFAFVGLADKKTTKRMREWLESTRAVMHFGIDTRPGSERRKLYVGAFGLDRLHLVEALRLLGAGPRLLRLLKDSRDAGDPSFIAADFSGPRAINYKLYYATTVDQVQVPGGNGDGKLLPFVKTLGKAGVGLRAFIMRRLSPECLPLGESVQIQMPRKCGWEGAVEYASACGFPQEVGRLKRLERLRCLRVTVLSENRDGRGDPHVYFAPDQAT